MDDDLKFTIQMNEASPEKVAPAIVQAAPSDTTRESLQLDSSNYDLKRAGHPKACIFTFLFKLLALLVYLFFGFTGNIFVFIMVILFSAFDFWTVKNITGRLLVGLKWENSYNDDGSQNWHFQSIDNFQGNAVDTAFFWSSQAGFTLVWGLFTFSNAFGLHFFWFSLDCIVISLCFTNLMGFYKCRGNHQKKMNNVKKDLTAKGIGMLGNFMMRQQS